jgi:hypothetical protein
MLLKKVPKTPKKAKQILGCDFASEGNEFQKYCRLDRGTKSNIKNTIREILVIRVLQA